jgi:N-acetylmuramoyl-L-alanine amidase
MRLAPYAFALGLAALLVGPGTTAQSAPRSPQPARIGGRDYVSASQWAASKGLTARWIKREETLQLNNDSATVVLKADAREAQINGVQVWLSYPVARAGGNLFVARADCQTTLEPILFPQKNPAGIKVRTICLDPGHGGKDPGNQVGSNQEKRYTLALVQELRAQLTRAGFKVILTRTRDTYVDLGWRPDIARRKNADLFLSIHFNSAESSRASVQGSEVYCLTPAGASSTNAQREGGGDWSTGNRNNAQNILLAYCVQKSLTERLAVQDRGARRARFAVLRDANMPATLIEAGFMSHPGEGRKIFSAEYRQQMARAICDAALNYKRMVERAS